MAKKKRYCPICNVLVNASDKNVMIGTNGLQHKKCKPFDPPFKTA